MTDMTSTTQNEDGLQVLKAIMFNWYRIETLTHYLPQTRKWHPCRPPRCVCCAWMGGEGKGQITAARGLTDLRGGGDLLPGSDELVAGRQPPPAADGLEGPEVQRQVFHAVGAAVVEVDTRGDFGGFARHRRRQRLPGLSSQSQPSFTWSPPGSRGLGRRSGGARRGEELHLNSAS